jgi:hypothetical protein
MRLRLRELRFQIYHDFCREDGTGQERVTGLEEEDPQHRGVMSDRWSGGEVVCTSIDSASNRGQAQAEMTIEEPMSADDIHSVPNATTTGYIRGGPGHMIPPNGTKRRTHREE